MNTILVVDDDLALADVISFALRRSGFEVILAHDGQTALEKFDAEAPDLVVLDWGLPQLDGLQVCKNIRTRSQAPIIMLTVRNTDDDVVAALEAGADDYVSKPFSPRRLIARIKAVLRRTVGEPEEVLRVGGCVLNVTSNEVNWQGEDIHLTRLESRLLQALMQNPDKVVTTESLITRVWGAAGASRDMLKQLVYRLRSKIEPTDENPTLIQNIPSKGYVFVVPDNNAAGG